MKRAFYTHPNDGSEHAGKFRIITPAYGKPGSTQGADESDDQFLARVVTLRIPAEVDYAIIDDSDPRCAAYFTDRIQVREDRRNGTDFASGPGLFRNAWTLVNGKLSCDMPKSRIIHMDRIRAKRDAELVKLDVAFIRAVESGDTVEQQRIAALKQSLRDIPQTFDLSTFRTPNTLKKAWPRGLPR